MTLAPFPARWFSCLHFYKWSATERGWLLWTCGQAVTGGCRSHSTICEAVGRSLGSICVQASNRVLAMLGQFRGSSHALFLPDACTSRSKRKESAPVQEHRFKFSWQRGRQQSSCAGLWIELSWEVRYWPMGVGHWQYLLLLLLLLLLDTGIDHNGRCSSMDTHGNWGES